MSEEGTEKSESSGRTETNNRDNGYENLKLTADLSDGPGRGVNENNDHLPGECLTVNETNGDQVLSTSTQVGEEAGKAPSEVLASCETLCTEPVEHSQNGTSKGDEPTTTASNEHGEIKGNASSDFPSERELDLTAEEKDDILQTKDQFSNGKLERESQSIYLSDDKPAVRQDGPVSKTPKRMTRAEKAALEALAAFGGSDFGSLSVRKVDLQGQLKMEAELRKRSEKEESSQNTSGHRPPKRLQKAREEVEQQFKDIAFGEGKKKYPKIAMAKQKAKLKEKEAAENKVAVKYQTRLQKSKAHSSEAFGGKGLDKLPMKKKEKLQSAHLSKLSGDAKQKVNKVQPTSSFSRTPKRTDKAKLEAMQTFGGDSLDKVLGNTRKRVARHFDTYPAKKAKVSGDTIEKDESEDPAPNNERKGSSDIEVPAA